MRKQGQSETEGSRLDRGLLATVLELEGDEGAPPTSAAVAGAVGVPAEYAAFIADRLEENERRGLVARDREGHWHVTDDGAAAVQREAPLF